MDSRCIKMLDSGPNNKYQAGQVIIVDKVRAAVLVSRGYAEPYEASKGEKVRENGVKTNNRRSGRAG